MKKFVLALIVILLSGCGAGAELRSFFSPIPEENHVPVVYPAEQAEGSEESSLGQAYGRFR